MQHAELLQYVHVQAAQLELANEHGLAWTTIYIAIPSGAFVAVVFLAAGYWRRRRRRIKDGRPKGS